MKKIWLLFFLIIMTTSTHAGQHITIVRGQNFPPYHYLDENGSETGFLIDIIRSTAASMDLDVQFKQYPWSRCLHMMKVGTADAMMNLFKTKERVQFLDFPDTPLAYEVNSFFKLKKIPVDYSGDMTVLNPFRIGFIRNYSYGPVFDAMNFPRTVMFETEQDLIKSLVKGNRQIVVGNKIVLQLLIRQMGFENHIDILSPAVSNDPLYIAFSKVRGHKQIAMQFSDALKQFKTTLAYKAILKKYDL
ncbi:MAG: transporter substrate-binding domain-containing protein [Desulfobacteraceae bacterium]|nr:transporter substrate-binding domain-containing protein [Desulfobacteraceae bacterium]